MKLVIDTSILIDHLRKGPALKKLFSEIETIESIELYIPTIVLFELFSGNSTRNPQVIKEINNLVRNFQKMPLNSSIARRAGELCRDLPQKIQPPDYIIAASALSIDGTIVTLNKKHFEPITGLQIYPI